MNRLLDLISVQETKYSLQIYVVINHNSLPNCPYCVCSSIEALGTKRLASEEFAHNLDNKRLNAGQVKNFF